MAVHVSELLAQAQGLHNVGASVKAAAVLGEIPIARVPSRDFFSAVMLSSDLAAFGIMTKNRTGDWSGDELVRICNARLRKPSASAAELALERSALSAVLALKAGSAEDRDGLFASIACGDDALRRPAYGGDRAAEEAFVAFHARYSIWQAEFGRHQEANDALAETALLVDGSRDLPVYTRFEDLTARAWMHSLTTRTAAAARQDVEAIRAFGISGSIPQALWTSAYFRALDLRVRGDVGGAIDLFRYVIDATRRNDTPYWEALIAPRLIFAIATSEGVAPARAALRGLRQPYPVLDEALACMEALCAGDYRTSEARATQLYRRFERYAHRMYRFVALILRANARRGLHDQAGCEADVDEALALCLATPTPFGYTLKRAAGAMASLSQNKRKVQRAREILAEIARGSAGGSPVSPLTARQQEIATLASQGASNAEIAARLRLSRRTVENHLFAAMQRLGIRARWQLRSALEP